MVSSRQTSRITRQESSSLCSVPSPVVRCVKITCTTDDDDGDAKRPVVGRRLRCNQITMRAHEARHDELPSYQYQYSRTRPKHASSVATCVCSHTHRIRAVNRCSSIMCCTSNAVIKCNGFRAVRPTSGWSIVRNDDDEMMRDMLLWVLSRSGRRRVSHAVIV